MKIIGHRGARGLAPENTLAGIQKALSLQVDEIEIDIQVTADNIPILFHDHTWRDDFGTMHKIKDSTYTQIKRQFEQLTTLKEALETTETQRPLLLEIKSIYGLGAVLTELREHVRPEIHAGSISLASFDYQILNTIHKEIPELELVVNEKWSGVRASYRARKLQTRRISMNHRWLYTLFVKKMYNSGILLSVYTVNSPARISAWKNYLYGVITDNPDRFK